MSLQKFDSIVIGAGPAGSTSAYVLAKSGFNVLLVERGKVAGSKNVFGGRIYINPLKEIYPDIEKAPIQRWVKKERISLVADGCLTLEFQHEKTTSFTAYLSKIAEWMAGKAEEAGATLVTEITVDSLLVEDGKVKGIVAGGDKVYSDVVVDAEGINRLLLERAGIVEKPKPENVALGIKEVIKLSKKDIEDRFGLDDDSGMAWLMMGDVTKGIPGGGFLYTNQDTVSLGIVVNLGGAIRMIKEYAYEIVERMRESPYLKKYLDGGSLVEYSAHLVPQASYKLIPKLYGDGFVVVGDAAGMLLDLGYTIRGVDLAAYSGYLAAKAIEKAHSSGGITAKNLSIYEKMLKESFVYKQIERFRGTERIFSDARIFTELPEAVTDILRRMFQIEYESDKLLNNARKVKGGLIRLLLDALKVVRSL
ncbi:MAG: FAD-dependent oxidoreductase [Candidatus Methanodesulfokora sp.]|jgi:electron transfer flavoprotein-quinone oxidoreductase